MVKADRDRNLIRILIHACKINIQPPAYNRVSTAHRHIHHAFVSSQINSVAKPAVGSALNASHLQVLLVRRLGQVRRVSHLAIHHMRNHAPALVPVIRIAIRKRERHRMVAVRRIPCPRNRFAGAQREIHRVFRQAGLLATALTFPGDQRCAGLVAQPVIVSQRPIGMRALHQIVIGHNLRLRCNGLVIAQQRDDRFIGIQLMPVAFVIHLGKAMPVWKSLPYSEPGRAPKIADVLAGVIAKRISIHIHALHHIAHFIVLRRCVKAIIDLELPQPTRLFLVAHLRPNQRFHKRLQTARIRLPLPLYPRIHDRRIADILQPH